MKTTINLPKTTHDEDGFSLIDVVVTVAIILALSVGGFISYMGLVESAQQGATDYAASNVFKAAATYENDSDPATTACSAVDEYNESGEGLTVSLVVLGEDGTPESAQRYAGKGEANSYTC